MADIERMRNCLTISVMSCLLGATFLATASSAQTIDSPYRFLDTRQSASLYSGYMKTGKGGLGLGPESGMVFGARYDITVGGAFGLGADISYFSQTRAVLDTVPNDTTRMQIGDSDFSTLVLGAALRFNLTGPRTYRGIQPFALFGVGLAIDLSDPSAEDQALAGNLRFDFGTSFIGQLGAGAEIMLSPRYSLRLELRNTLWKIETPEAFLIKGDQALLLPADEWAQNLGFSAGLAIRF